MQKPLQTIYPYIDKTGILVEPWDILKLLGNQQGAIDAHTTALVDQYVAECLRVSSPTGAFVLADAVEAESSLEIIIPGVTFHPGRIIHNMLQHSKNYALFLVTAGPEPENLVRTLLEQENYLEGYIADLIASAIVESVAGQVEEQVRKLANNRGLKITSRYSPGYCSWNVEEQQKLFSLFPKACCGISLSESSLMNPIKSASGIIGIGAEVEYRDYTCEICPMINCQFRNSAQNL
ncbi:MAG: methionine synthase [Bacteroidales bacterium]|nr:methionine synthase [Bacteroidales bacterium]